MTQDTPAHPAPPATLDDTPRFQIGEVAERTGVTQRTLRFYEEKGLMPPPKRMEGGFRLYSEQDIARIEQIRKLQQLLGFTLSEIKEMVEADELRRQIVATFRPDREMPKRKERTEQIIDALRRQLDVVEPKIEQLIEMRDELKQRLRWVEHRREQIIEAMETGRNRLEGEE